MVTLDAPRVAATHHQRLDPPPQATALCTMPAAEASVPALRRFARDTARRWAVPVDGTDALLLVVTELVTNAVLHSGSAEVSVLLTYRDGGLTVEVKDSGQWYARRGPRRAGADAGAACGRGLELVRHLTDWWLAYLSPTGTRVVARVPVPAAA